MCFLYESYNPMEDFFNYHACQENTYLLTCQGIILLWIKIHITLKADMVESVGYVWIEKCCN